MIRIEVIAKGKRIEVETRAEIEGYSNAVAQFVAVLNALDKTSEDVFSGRTRRIYEGKNGGQRQ